MFEGISPGQWLAAVVLAATGAGFIGLVPRTRIRRALLCLWVFGPLFLALSTSSFGNLEEAAGLVLLYLLLPTLPWSVVSIGAFLIARLVFRLSGRKREPHR